MNKATRTAATLKKRSLFWDVDLKEKDVGRYRDFIIGRILNNGDLEDYLWAVSRFGRKTISDHVLTARDLSNKSLNFWRLIFKIDKKACIRNQSTKKLSMFSRR